MIRLFHKAVKMSQLNADNYGQLLGEIKQHIRSAQYEALKVVNQKSRFDAIAQGKILLFNLQFRLPNQCIY